MHTVRLRLQLRNLERSFTRCMNTCTVSKAQFTGVGTVGNFVHTPQREGEFQLKTAMNPLSEEMEAMDMLGIRGYSPLGFRLVDNTFLFGPIALFRKTVLSWRIRKVEDIVPDSVELFTFLVPKVDLLIISPGEYKHVDYVRKNIAPFLRQHKIPFEILATEEAIGVYNHLNFEHRHICALMFPPDEVVTTREDHQHLLHDMGVDIDSFEQIWPELFETEPPPGMQKLDSHRDVIHRLWRLEAGAEEKPAEMTDLERQRKTMETLRHKILTSGYTFAKEEKEKHKEEQEKMKIEQQNKYKQLSDKYKNDE